MHVGSGIIISSRGMAAVRGFSLEKIASVRMVFSVFDSKATSTRCTCSRKQHLMVALHVWPVHNVCICMYDDNFCPYNHAQGVYA